MANHGERPSGQKATLPLPTAVQMRDELADRPFARPDEDGQLVLLPTPTDYVGDQVDGQLPTEIAMLPTPVANPDNPGAGGELRAAIVHGEGRRNETGVDSMGRPNEGRPSRLLPSPATRDHHAQGAGHNEEARSSGLATVVQKGKLSEGEPRVLGRGSLRDSELSSEGEGAGMVCDALQALACDGRSDGDESDGATASPRDGALLGEGGEDGGVLDLARGEGEQVGPREVHEGGRIEREGASLRVRDVGGADPRGTDDRPSLPSASLRESRPLRSGDDDRESASAGSGSDALPAGASSERYESLSAAEDGLASVSDMPTSARPQIEWGVYRAAVERWEAVFGQPAPAPTDEKGRLAPEFVEWMLGYPPSWFDVEGVSRTRKLRALGNSVQVQVAEAVGHWLAGLLDSGLLLGAD